MGRRQRQVCRSDRRSTIPIAHTSKGPMQHHPSAVVGPAATSEVPGPRGDVPSPGLLQSLPLNGVFSSIFSGTARLLHSLALPPPAGHPAHPTAEVNLLGQATSCLRLSARPRAQVGKTFPWVPLAASHKPYQCRRTNLAFRMVTGEHSTLPSWILLKCQPKGARLSPQPAILRLFAQAFSAISKPTSQCRLSAGNEARRGRQGAHFPAWKSCAGAGEMQGCTQGYTESQWQKSVPR